MYAVIETGGKQYMVEEGMNLRVEKLEGDKGNELNFDSIVLVGGDGKPRVGTPYVEGATVTAKVAEQGRERKVLVYHKKRRKGYEKRHGHRQSYTELTITKINA